MEIEQAPIDSLRADELNPRRMRTHEAEALKRSLAEYGAVEPAVVNADGTIIGGHMRVAAARELGWTEFPVVRRSVELDPAYCDVAVQRWEEMTGGTAKRGARRKAKATA